ncbi:MAG: hypothetical protein ACLRP9_01610 [Anaerovoracaceae bacterium]
MKIKHCVSIYTCKGRTYAEAWIMVRITKRKAWCLWKRREEIPVERHLSGSQRNKKVNGCT